MTQTTSFPKNQIKVLLLEGLHKESVRRIEAEGFHVISEKRAYDEAELLEIIPEIHVLGIRSKTYVSAKAMAKAKRLLSIGAFCIGTNQIDLRAAKIQGVPVFNAPYSNTRSVAELVIAEVIMLARQLFGKISSAHAGEWNKSAAGSMEVRGKTLGIIGYGHIGQQVSVLAEALGMRVLFYDVVDKLTMGNATRVPDLRDLMERSDYVTLHVPGTRDTQGMIGAKQLDWMKSGACLINASRGTVVDIDALAARLKSGRLAGAAIDVFPEEPKSVGDRFSSPLQGLPNVLLTPHIGGSTEEAQRNIGLEVAMKLIRFVNNGSTEGAVNFPNEVLPEMADQHRILHIHQNVPGVLQKVNTLFGEAGINVTGQFLRTYEDVGYLIMDANKNATQKIIRDLKNMPETIKVRALF
ncbi:MAG: phosphoglycerate dehydrogenase [Candidatus Hydrogenedentes bacterium]|nr:phosphoglycerate dehydrogenase [Candidatus Hydrogenedentota bacterium]